ncbi:MAG: hypothetical protein JWM59_3152 [Verrucomicrobiales bacterium]|nr:hypothetical protein [Verrucomicrobiales bacterium]
MHYCTPVGTLTWTLGKPLQKNIPFPWDSNPETVMKTPAFLCRLKLSPAIVLVIGSLGLTGISQAKPDHRSGHGGYGHSRGQSYSPYRHYNPGPRYDSDRHGYMNHPRSSFGLSIGNGYAGRGYYYGPPHAAYYYERPGVTYYRTQAVVPRVYLSSPGYYSASPRYYRRNDAIRCQSALSRMGYYYGPIDGDIGPGSCAAIRRYQMRNGLTVTGYMDSGLLLSLGIR